MKSAGVEVEEVRDGSSDFILAQGLPFVAHLLRRLSDHMVADAGAFYARRGIVAPARTASTLRLLAEHGPQSVTQIAQRLKQSHPLVITWIRQLAELGLVSSSVDPADRRRTLVSLTDAGGDEARRMAAALERLGRAYQSVLDEAGDDVFGALCRIADRLDKGGLAGELRRDES